LYVGWGVTFPSAPVIDRGDGRNQVLQQGSSAGGPDPSPRRVRCAPLVIQFDRSMGVREVRLRVFNRHLRAYSVSARSGRSEIDAFRFAPRGDARPRPPVVTYSDIVLRASYGEGDIDRIEANPPDDCFDLMVIDNLAFDALRPRSVPNLVWAGAYEVNQGVMSQLTPVSDPLIASRPNTQLMALPAKRLPFVKNRNTTARFYLSSTVADIDRYAARLRVVITNADGRTTTQTINENTRPAVGPPTSAEPRVMRLDWLGADADARRHFVRRRGRTDQSHDFVVPAAQLLNATSADLVLLGPDGEQLASVRLDFSGPFTIGLNYFRIQALGATPMGLVAIGGPIPLEPARGRIRAFMRDLMPLSGNVRTVDNGVVSVSQAVGITDTCDNLLATLAAMATGTPEVARVNHWTNIFVAQATPSDCVGLGLYGIQATLTVPGVDVVAHEVSHNLGIQHASTSHGEGRWPEPWPYFHGSMGTVDEPLSFLFGAYGVAVTRTSLVPTADWGVWMLDVVNPCPGGAAIFPTCGAPDAQIVHDYMSYGLPTPMPTYGNVPWISDINYFRVFRFLEECVSQDPPASFLTGETATYPVSGCSGARSAAGMAGPAGSLTRVPADGLVFSGVLSREGKIESFRVLRNFVALPSIKQGTHSLVMRARDGKVVRTVPFVLLDSDGKKERRSFLIATPFEPALATVALYEGTRLLFERKASATPPEVQLVSPKGGETWRQGKQKIVWQLQDMDGDRLETFVAYSADGGKSWLPLGLVDGRINSIEVDIANLVPTREALIQVAVSDGLNTQTARSAGIFAISDVGQREKE
jgi:hypothetical protein